MPLGFEFKPPAVDARVLVAAAADVGVNEAADHLLAVAVDRCPKDTGRLRDSGHKTDLTGLDAGMSIPHMAAVSFGNEDGDAQHEDTAAYAVFVEVLDRLSHPIGEAHYLETSMHSEKGAMLGLAAAPIRAVLGGIA